MTRRPLPGPPPTGAREEAPAGVVVGIDVGGTTIHAAAIDPATDRLLAEHRLPTPFGPDQLLVHIVEAYRAVLPAGARAAGLGVGVPGVVTEGTVRHAVNLGIGAAALDLRSELIALGLGPVAVGHDVTVAALGARPWLQALEPGVDDYAVLNVGTGLAAGLVLEGGLRGGATGVAGEIGHLPFDRSGPSCPCGRRGCLELYASGSGLRRRWTGTAAELFAAAEAGDLRARDVADDLTQGLAHAVCLLAYTIDVERILLTGGVVSSTPALRKALVAHLDATENTPFADAAAVASRLLWLPADEPVGVLGAARLALDGTDARPAGQVSA